MVLGMSKRGLGVLIIVALLVGGIFYLSGPSTVLVKDIKVAGAGTVLEHFQVSGFRNQMYVRIVIEGESIGSILNITVQDPNGVNIYSIQDIYGERTYFINETINIASSGKYKLIIIFIGDINLNISIKAYHTLFSFLVSKE